MKDSLAVKAMAITGVAIVIGASVGTCMALYGGMIYFVVRIARLAWSGA